MSSVKHELENWHNKKNGTMSRNKQTELKEDGNLFFKTDILPISLITYKTEFITLPNYNSSEQISHGNIIA